MSIYYIQWHIGGRDLVQGCGILIYLSLGWRAGPGLLRAPGPWAPLSSDRPLVELCENLRVFPEDARGVSAPTCCAFIHRVAFDQQTSPLLSHSHPVSPV